MNAKTAVLSMCALGLMASAAAAPPEALIKLRHHLIDGDLNTLTFRSIDQMFETIRVETAGKPSPLAESPATLDFSYDFEGQSVPAADFALRTFTNALVIVKGDRIVFEKYFNNTGPDTHFLSMSMAKSITSTLIGMAVDDGAIASVDDPIVKYVPELKGSGYDGVTIRQALLMRSGVDWNERYDFGKESPMKRLHNAAIVENRERFADQALTLKRAHAPGEAFNYSTVETAVLGRVVEGATKRPLPQYMSERWWRRTGMQSYGYWLADGEPGVGRAVNGMGFNATLRDFARFGLMMLHEGRINGQQLVSPKWVQEATRPQGTEPAAPGSTRGYQYQWWTLTDSEAYMAVGLQGQFTYIDPTTDTVVVKVSYFPPGELRADVETEAFFRAVSKWRPGMR